MTPPKPANNLALYRKYRPQIFKEVIEQDHIIAALEGSIQAGKISHAYLFHGSRGTGKTSVARIFAREIGTGDDDLYEIDAASNRGIDDVRELREGVNTLPFKSKYKVYIVDEVHMLTKEAFNALLKTLEEPPAHAVFILATTEIDKLPETIVSRCQVFNFKKPSQAAFRKMVASIAKQEGYTLEAGALELIAFLGDGSFRDALGILQKVLGSSKDKKITEGEVEMITGTPKATLVNQYIEAIDEADTQKGLNAVKGASEANVDMKSYLKLILYKIRLVLLLKYAKDMEEGIKGEIGEADFNFLKKLSAKPDSKISSRTILELLDALDRVGTSYLPELPLELALIKLCQEI